MYKITVIVLSGLLFTSGLKAQNWEGGTFLGASNYRGEMAPYVVPSESHPALGVFVKRNLSQFFSFNLSIKQGEISGSDQNYDQLAKRNLSFESRITEIASTVEFNFFPFLKGLKPDQFTPFVYSGLALFRFNPKTTLNNKTLALDKFNTEGQGLSSEYPNDYSLFQPSVPIGGGIKLQLNRRLNLTFKLGYRATFTDFIDDVSTTYPSKDKLRSNYGDIAVKLSDRSREDFYSIPGKQRGDPQTNDWYIFSGFTFSYNIENPVCYDF